MTTNISLFFISCPTGLEGILETELTLLGIPIGDQQLGVGGISFQATANHGFDALLKSRVASRVFLHLFDFNFRQEKEIFQKALKKKWDDYLELQQTFKITTILDRPSSKHFKNSLVLSQILKDGIADYFRQKKGERPSVDTKNPDQRFLLRIEDDPTNRAFKATIWLDLCGDPLSNRGYRRPGHVAPLRENLAAGIIQLTDWRKEREPFIDLFCGSGTLLIEGLLIAKDISPSYLKVKSYLTGRSTPWAFMRNPWYTAQKQLGAQVDQQLKKLDQENSKSLKKKISSHFFGIDIDPRALGLAKENIDRALLSGQILLGVGDARKNPPPIAPPGIVVGNLPYGERIEIPLEELKNLYHDTGENLKANYKGFRAYFLTSHSDLRKQIALATSKRVELFNGDIECRLLRYDLY